MLIKRNRVYGQKTPLKGIMKVGADSAETGLDSGRRKSQPFLETIFQSDRQQILQSAGRQVLQDLYPMKEIYYQVKDTMRLAGVVRTCPFLASKVGVGGATTAWVIQEFAAQMHAVCKIAMHRRANLAAFLENQGILSVTPLCYIVCFFVIYISRVPYLLIFIIVCI